MNEARQEADFQYLAVLGVKKIRFNEHMPMTALSASVIAKIKKILTILKLLACFITDP